MKMPALAVVGPDHRIILSTESFRRRYEDAESVFGQSPEIEKVLTGRADVATVTLGDLSATVEAVTDASGCRQAMLTLPPVDLTAVPEPPVSALCDAADESPAIVWVKDLEGRYLYANPRYARDLGTSEERLRGNTDADLPETETVDGPRLRYAKDGLEEPLQLEYTIPAIDRRPAMAVFRFPLHDDAGEAVATCGVAVPVSEAQVARDEAVRLMQLERWTRLDPDDVRAEVLEQWHVQTAPPREDDQADEAREAQSADSVAPKQAEETSRPSKSTAARAPAPPPAEAQAPTAPSLSETAELLQTNLQLARKWADRAEQLQAELHDSQVRIRQAESEAQEAVAAAARAAEEAGRWRSELEQARFEVEEARAEAHAARSEAEAARGDLGAAQAQAEALRGPSAIALRLSEELGRVVATERERSDDLERTLARLQARLSDLEIAFDGSPPAATPPE